MLINMIVEEIVSEILKEKPEYILPIFYTAFQRKPGGYGENDQFCGTSMTILRKIAKNYRNISLQDSEKLLHHELHEARFVALVILRYQFYKTPRESLDVHFNNLEYVNNWDLVDISAHHLLGKYCLMTGDVSKIYELSEADNFWKNRIAVVSTLAFIKDNQFMLTLDLCEKYLHHEHHLVQKACGWMLREVSKRYPDAIIDFIKDHQDISSIMKSYALEWIRKKAKRS